MAAEACKGPSIRVGCRRRFAHRSGCVGAMLLHDDVRDVRDALFPTG